jgi:hypothetical protein
MNEETIREDVATEQNTDTSLTRDGAVDAFLNRWEKKDGPKDSSDNSDKGAKVPEKKETASPETDDEEELIEDDDSSDQEEQEDDSDTESTETIAGDEAKVKIVVDGKEVTATVKDLKRLYGQEAALTRKSQEVAERRKALDTVHNAHATALKTLVERAAEKYKPYANADMIALSHKLTPEEFQAVREDAVKSFEDYKFLTQELENVTKASQARAHSEYLERAKAAVEALQHPETGIKGFNEQVYTDLEKFAVEQGLSADLFRAITDPALIKLLHAAQRYERAKKITAEKKAKPVKKVMKSRQPTDASGRFVKDNSKAMDKLKATGSRDAAADAFLAKWGIND